MKRKKKIKKLELKKATVQQMDGAGGGLSLWNCTGTSVFCGPTDSCPPPTADVCGSVFSCFVTYCNC